MHRLKQFMFKQVKMGVLGEDQVDSETEDELFQSWLHWEFVRHVVVICCSRW